MNNREWLNSLAHTSPFELKAWFDAEHDKEGRKETEPGVEHENVKHAKLLGTEYELVVTDELHKPTDAVREFAERYERRIAELEAERDGWRELCGKLLDAAHAMQLIADGWEVES